VTAFITVEAKGRPTEVFAFPMEDGQPAANGEWQLIDTLQPGETGEYIAHSRRMILAQIIPNLSPEMAV
jgi:hypothetical protein